LVLLASRSSAGQRHRTRRRLARLNRAADAELVEIGVDRQVLQHRLTEQCYTSQQVRSTHDS